MVGYHRCNGVTETKVDNDRFLVGPGNVDSFQLDPVSGNLWDMLVSPTDVAAAVASFSAAYPEAEPAILAADIKLALRRMSNAGLVAAA